QHHVLFGFSPNRRKEAAELRLNEAFVERILTALKHSRRRQFRFLLLMVLLERGRLFRPFGLHRINGVWRGGRRSSSPSFRRLCRGIPGGRFLLEAGPHGKKNDRRKYAEKRNR